MQETVRRHLTDGENTVTINNDRLKARLPAGGRGTLFFDKNPWFVHTTVFSAPDEAGGASFLGGCGVSAAGRIGIAY